MTSHSTIKERFLKLSSSERSQLLEELLQEHELQGVILEEAESEISHKRLRKPCPHCKSSKVNKRGKKKGVQMYQCCECSRWYSETTGTALYEIKLKEKWQSYLRCMEQGMSIKKIAKELHISIQTSFNWRHRILSSLEQFIPESLGSEIECDELELALNEKGNRNLERAPRKRGTDFKRNQGKDEITVVQVVTAVERQGSKYLKAVESKRLSKEEIEKALDSKLEKDSVLITDKHRSYKAFAKDHPQIQHKTLLAKDHVDKKDKSIHLQNVNNVHSQIRDFLRPFNGVSSKYLQNYLNWYAYADSIKNSKTVLKNWLLAILLSDNAYQIFELFKQNAVLIRT